MQILQSIDHSECGPHVEMQRAVSQRGKVNQQNSALRFLKCNRGVDGNRGAARAALGIYDGKYSCASRGSAAFAARCRKTIESLNQGFRGSVTLQKFAGPGAHRSHDGGRMTHLADGKNRDVAGVRLNQFDGADGSVRVVRVNVEEDYFGPHVLHLAQHRVGGAGRKSRVAEDIPAHPGALQTVLEYGEPFSVFAQESNCNALHRRDLNLS